MAVPRRAHGSAVGGAESDPRRVRDGIEAGELDAPQLAGGLREHEQVGAGDGPAVELVDADARLALERELNRGQPGAFDVLVVDAFSGDAPPIHLLTCEALAVYVEHLAAGGVLAVNVSNRFVDLERVVAGPARQRGIQEVTVADLGDPRRALHASNGVLATDNHRLPEHDALELADEAPAGRPPVVWTDDHAGLLGLVSLSP